MRASRARWTSCVLLALALCAVWVWRAPLGRAALAVLIDVPTGGRISFERVSLGADVASFERVRFVYEGVPLLQARSVRLRYRLRDLFAGGTRRFGLIALGLDEPEVVLVRRADRSFVVPGAALPHASRPSSGSSAAGIPLRFTAVVRDGSLELLDAARALPGSRRFVLAHIDGRGVVDSAAITRYRARGELDGTKGERFALFGRVDARGSAEHRFRASALPLAGFVNYFINTRTAAFESANLVDVDLHAYAFVRDGRPGPYHIAGSGTLVGGSMHVPGLVPEATEMHGRVDLFDDGVASPKLEARLGPARVRLAGGLYGWSAPQFRLGIVGAGDLRRLRGLFRFSRALPLEGRVALETLLEGPVAMPLVATRVAAPHARYAKFPIDDARARALYFAQRVAIVGARGRYGGFDLAANGSLALGTVTHTELVLAATGGTSHVPYLAAAAPGIRLGAQALLVGSGLRFDVRGALGADGGATRLSGLFHVDPAAEGNLGPFALARADGASLQGAFYLRRSASESGFWLAGSRYPMSALAQRAALPGVALAAPDFLGRLSGSLVGVGPPSHFRVAGRVRGDGMRVGSLLLDAAAGDLAGAPGALRLANVRARGPWGRFAGRGAYTGGQLALEGNYGGDFTELATFTGDLGARGPVAGPVAVLVDSKRTLVQARGTSAIGSSVHGLQLGRVSGTLAVERGALRIYGATAAVAGGSAAAAGVLAPAARLAVSLANADAAGAVRVAGLAPGRLSAVGTVVLSGRAPEFDGGVAVGDGRYAGIPFAGNADVALRSAELRVAAADATVGSTVGRFTGTIAAPGTAAQSYDLGITIPASPLGPVARTFAPRVPFLVGTAAAEVRLRGRPARLRLEGTLAAPEGSLNGLAFAAFRAHVRVDAQGFDARAGRVDVGTTRTNFAASYRGAQASLHVDAPHAELADFNDFFDAGDTLEGAGRVRARFAQARARVATDADVAIAGLRYRRFELGNATARWTSSGRRVRGRLAFGGISGSLETAGTLELARAAPSSLIAASRFVGTARLANLDLGVWLPALGYQVPVAGRLDARATISGSLADPNVVTTATLENGSLGTLPVDRLVVRAASTLRRTTVERAELQLPSLDAVMSGSFGLRERDPLALAVHVDSSNIGTLAARLSLGGWASSGTAEADVKIDGTLGNPRVTGGFDVARAVLHGVSIPLALGQFSLHGRDAVLSGVEVDFATGSLVLAGSVPLQIAPFGFGPPAAAIALEASASAIDLKDFAPLLPEGSLLAGTIDGRVGIGGTAAAPRLAGGVTLAAGSLRTPAETIPLTALQGRLAFEGNTVRLSGLQAKAGSGTLTGSGAASIPDIVHPGEDTTYAFLARATRATLNFPAYGGGQLDGTLQFSRAAGELPLVRGRVSLSEAAIPFSTLLGASGAGGANASVEPPNVALDLALIADRNVRVRSANVDIGARGSIHAGGTLLAPSLAGAFTSTGGTLAYFNTVFRLLDGTVTFRPDLGVIPTLDARAITHVVDSDPNTVRNAAGSADITLAVAGPLSGLSLTLSSNPAYDRQQILGLLLGAPAFGATNLFGDTAQSPTYYGSTNTAQLSPQALASRSASGSIGVAQEAFGVANAEFTRTLLAPFETTFAGALGLSNFNVNVDYTGNVGLSARKVLGKDINAIYDTTFGYPYRQTFGFEIKPNAFEAAQVTVFQTLGAYDLNSLTPTGYITSLNSKVRTAQPESGSSGFSLSIQRLFP